MQSLDKRVADILVWVLLLTMPYWLTAIGGYASLGSRILILALAALLFFHFLMLQDAGMSRRELERACPRLLPTVSPQDPPRIRFTGDAEALSMLAPAAGAAGGQSCAPTTLHTEPDGRLQQIAVNDTAVLRHVQALEIAYLPAQGDWRGNWRNQPVLPTLIRVRVTFPKGDGRTWPELFVTPRISADGDCTYDPQTKLCRGT